MVGCSKLILKILQVWGIFVCLMIRVDQSRAVETASPEEVARQAGLVLNRYCSRCHRGAGSVSGSTFDVRTAASLIDQSMVTASRAEDSELLRVMEQGWMPPRNQSGLPRPSANEIKSVRAWIEQGATEFPKPSRRPFVAYRKMLESIVAHYKGMDPTSRGNYRYFTLVNLHNDPGIDPQTLRMARAALAKALNSLSWRPKLVIPERVSIEGLDDELVYAIDIDKLGWTREHWNALVDEYPYAVGGKALADDRVQQLEGELEQLSGNDAALKHLRADWLVTIGLRPKLYHKLLYDLTLPDLRGRPLDARQPNNPKRMTDRDLERFLAIDVNANMFAEQPKAQRAGFTESGISGQNRMLERHPMTFKVNSDRITYYWKSYDFLGSNSRSILAEFPLGPVRPNDDPRNAFAFQHDGGEIIFSLPNGLQGYLLASGKGDRLDAGPIEIVGDALKTSGNQLIVNGLSCVVCHKHGMIWPKPDEIRSTADSFLGLRKQITDLYVENNVMNDLIEGDQDAFMDSLSGLIRPFLLQGDDSQATLDDLPEPVGEISRAHLLEPMDLDTVAAELYISDTDDLKILLASGGARSLGVGILRQDSGTIKRDAWQNRQGQGRSLMRQAVDILGFGRKQVSN